MLSKVKSSGGGTFDARSIRYIVDRYEEVRYWITLRYSNIGWHMPHIDTSIFTVKAIGGAVEKFVLTGSEAEIVLQDVILGLSVAEQGLQALLKPAVEPSVLG